MVAKDCFGQRDRFGQQLEPAQGNAAVATFGSGLYAGEKGLVRYYGTSGEAPRECFFFVLVFGRKTRRAAVEAGYGGREG